MVTVYCRKSVDKEDDPSGSITLQKKLGKEFAERKGMSYRYYIDEDVSGTLENKPQYTQMLMDMSSKGSEIKIVFAQDQSRLYRNDEVRLQFLSLCRKYGIELYYQSGKFDWSNPEMKLLDAIMSAVGVFHVDVTREKITSVLRMKAEEGKVHGILPFGYHSIDQKAEIHEESAKVVREIFEMSMAGMGSRAIAQQLNEAKTPTYYNLRGGIRKTTNKITGEESIIKNEDSVWHGKTVMSILKNLAYTGKWKYSDIELEIPPIIGKEVFEKTQEMIKARKGASGKRNWHEYLLNDLVFCAKCGKRMTGRKVNNHVYYRCVSLIKTGKSCGNGGIRMKELDLLLWSSLFNQGRLVDVVLENIDNPESKKRIFELEGLIEEYDKKIQSFQKEKTKAIKLVLADKLKEEDIKGIVEENDREVRTLQIKQQKFQEELRHFKESKELSDDIQEKIKAVREDSPFNEKQRLLFEYIDRVEVLNSGKHTVKIHYKVKGLQPDTFTINKEYTMAVLRNNRGNSIALIDKKAFDDSQFVYLEHELGWWDIYPKDIPEFAPDEEYLKYLDSKR